MVRKELRDGLVLRSISKGTEQDRANLPQFFCNVFTDEYGPEDEVVKPFCRDLVSGNHPTVTDDDIWVIVDPSQDDLIVCALMLIPQVWEYAGIELKVGRVELVATRKEYRHRGLVRELMHTAHKRSEALGHSIQSITGIPYYYRQFGYGMTVNLGASTYMPLEAISSPKEDKEPTFTLRLGTADDIPTIDMLSEYYGKQCLMYTVRSDAEWKHEFYGKQPDNDEFITFLMIEDQESQAVGYLGYVVRPNGTFNIVALVIGETSSYLAAVPDTLWGLKIHLLERFANDENIEPRFLRFDTGLHPTILRILSHNAYVNSKPWSYSWYIRVPDWAAFFENIAPVLEERLHGSGAHGYTGEFIIKFHNLTGLKLTFEHGKLKSAENLHKFAGHSQAAFPFDSFMDIVFGFRTVDEITGYHVDAFTHSAVAVVLDTIFPKQRSWLLSIN